MVLWLKNENSVRRRARIKQNVEEWRSFFGVQGVCLRKCVSECKYGDEICRD